MSIYQLNKLREHKGCGPLMVGLMILFGLCFAFMGTNSPFKPFIGNDPTKGVDAVGSVGKQPILGAAIQAYITEGQKRMEDQGQQGGQAPDTTNPMIKLYLDEQAVEEAASAAATASIADDKNIHLDDKQVLAEIQKTFEAQKADIVSRLKMMGKLKDNSTDADFEAAYKEVSGQSFADQLKDANTQIADALADPEKAPLVRAQAISAAVHDSLVSQTKITDDQLKASFDKFDFDVINLSGSNIKMEDALANAVKAEADLKAGKTFEDVQKTYNVVDPAAKTPNTTASLTRTTIESQEFTKSLATLKPGQVSDTVSQPSGVMIYRLKTVTPAVPPDFDKNKGTLLSQKQDSLVAQQMNDLIDAKFKNDTKWNVDSLKTFFEYIMYMRDPKTSSSPSSQRQPELEKLLADANAVKDTTSNVLSDQFIALMKVGLTTELYGNASPTDKPKFAKAKLDAMVDAFKYTENARARLDTAALAAEVGDKAQMVTQLTQAATDNNDFTGAGLKLNADIAQFLTDHTKDGSITADQAKVVQVGLDKWAAGEADYTKRQADLAKQQAQMQAQIKAVQDKAAADKAKAGTATPPAAATPAPTDTKAAPAPSSTAPPASGNPIQGSLAPQGATPPATTDSGKPGGK